MKWLSFPLRFASLVVLLCTMLLHPVHTPASGWIRHVTPNGSQSGDCSSSFWSNPCTLQYALSIAQPGDEIWVKAGIYRPATNDDRAVSFGLKDGVVILGGFAGNEQNRDERRWGKQPTILSGDLLGNDSGEARWDNPTFSENSYHVVTANGVSSAAVLDGFTIRGGNANGSSSGDFAMNGGGINLISSSPTLTNLIISGNTSGEGADGGGISAGYYNSKPWLTNILFTGNQAGSRGGAIYNNGGSPVLTNVTLVGNQAGDRGGAIFTIRGSMPIRNSIIWGNSAPSNPSIEINITYLTLTYSDVQDGCPSGGPLHHTCDETVRYDDPHFIDVPGSDGIYGTTDDNPHLQSDSVVINQGSNQVTDPALSPYDLDGLPRIVAHTVDMGAYELQSNDHLPITSDQAFRMAPDIPNIGRLAASDEDDDPLLFLLFGDPPTGNFNLYDDGSFTYTPPLGFTGMVNFQFKVSDHIANPVGPYTATINVLYTLFCPILVFR